jgi:hypothetical protein
MLRSHAYALGNHSQLPVALPLLRDIAPSEGQFGMKREAVRGRRRKRCIRGDASARHSLFVPVVLHVSRCFNKSCSPQSLDNGQ